MACAWAVKATGTRATVYLPGTAPAFKVAKLEGLDADVRLIGTEYAHALEAAVEYATTSGARLSHAYDHPLIAAGAGTLAAEILAHVPDVDTIVVAVGGGGLFAGTAAAVAGTGVMVVAVEKVNCRGLNAAIEHGGPVDVTVDSVAADSLGARRASQMAYDFAVYSRAGAALVTDDAIVNARQILWGNRRVVVDTVAQRRWPRCCPAHPHPVQQSGSQLCCAQRTPTRLTWSSGEEFAGEYPTDAGQAGVLCTLIGMGVCSARASRRPSLTRLVPSGPSSECNWPATPRACQFPDPLP